MENPALASVRVLGSQVGFACARDVKARIDERVEHACAVSDEADADLIQNPRMQLVAALSAGWGFSGFANLLDALQLHRIGPTVALVHYIAQGVEGILIAGRRNV